MPPRTPPNAASLMAAAATGNHVRALLAGCAAAAALPAMLSVAAPPFPLTAPAAPSFMLLMLLAFMFRTLVLVPVLKIVLAMLRLFYLPS